MTGGGLWCGANELILDHISLCCEPANKSSKLDCQILQRDFFASSFDSSSHNDDTYVCVSKAGTVIK